MCFDECPALPATDAQVAESMRLSMRWARARARRSATGPGTRCSAFSRAGWTQELRAESAEALRAIGFDGYAVGGLAVGEGQEAMFGVLDYAPGHAARGQAALPDGGGQARRYRGRRQARDRHDGLRAALALGPDRAGLHAARRSTSRTPATPTTRARWMSTAPVRPVAAIPAPICTMSSAARRSSPPCC
jgi:hypothetical protein